MRDSQHQMRKTTTGSSITTSITMLHTTPIDIQWRRVGRNPCQRKHTDAKHIQEERAVLFTSRDVRIFPYPVGQTQNTHTLTNVHTGISNDPKFMRQQKRRRQTKIRKCSVYAFGRRRSTLLSARGSIVPGLNRMRRSVFYGGEDVEKFDQESASILIQSMARGYLVRSLKYRQERLRLVNKAVTRVQCLARQFVARRKLRERRVRGVRARAIFTFFHASTLRTSLKV